MKSLFMAVKPAHWSKGL